MIETKENENKVIREKVKLDIAYDNFRKVIDNNLSDKLSFLDDWLVKYSKLLLMENKDNNLQKTFWTYKRGTIVKADFGVGVGSEISQVHFAIVLNKYDNPKNMVLNVIPLTSKKDNFNLPLGNLINEMATKRVKEILMPIQCKIENNEKLTFEEYKTFNEAKKIIANHEKCIKSTYACCNLITTISKERLFPPNDKYDIVGRSRCSKDIMKKVNDAIMRDLGLTS